MVENAAPRRSRLGRRAIPLRRVRTAAGVVVCERCEVADRYFARMRGLLGRKSLEPGGGMLLTPEKSVHMFFMRFPIDVVFLDRDHKVVGVRHELRPWQMAGARGAHAALELPAGSASASGISEGEVLVFEDALLGGAC
jgi:uncharacterized membrane protein (UPF0127 family)